MTDLKAAKEEKVKTYTCRSQRFSAEDEMENQANVAVKV
jgi:hypothetical protein